LKNRILDILQLLNCQWLHAAIPSIRPIVSTPRPFPSIQGRLSAIPPTRSSATFPINAEKLESTPVVDAHSNGFTDRVAATTG
jgi:hypothetical protein